MAVDLDTAPLRVFRVPPAPGQPLAPVDRARVWWATRTYQRTAPPVPPRSRHRKPIDRYRLVTAALWTLVGACVAAGVAVGVCWAAPGGNPVVGTVTAVHVGPAPRHVSRGLMPGMVLTWSDPAAAHITVTPIGPGLPWTVPMSAEDARQCLLGGAWRLDTECEE